MSTRARWILIGLLGLMVHILYLIVGLLGILWDSGGLPRQARFAGIFPYGSIDYSTAADLALVEVLVVVVLWIVFAILLIRRAGEE